MKNLATLILFTIIAFSYNNVIAQKTNKKATIIIKTSTQCNMCKNRVEKEMAYTKGIISASLNVDKAQLTVKYKTHKTSPEKIRKAISNIGYDADNIKANEQAYEKLPKCCKKGGMSH